MNVIEHENIDRPLQTLAESGAIHKAAATCYALAGLGLTVIGLMQAPEHASLKFFIYLICAGIASLGARLANHQNLVPLGFLVVLVGLGDIQLPELLFLALILVLLHELRSNSGRPRMKTLVLGLASATIGVASAQMAYRGVALLQFNILYPAPLIAGAVALLLNFQLAAMLARERTLSFMELYRKECRPQLPWLVAAAYLACLVQYAAHQTGMHAGLIALPILVALDRGYRAWSQAEAKHTAELELLHERTLETLSMAIDARDHTTQMHLRRVQFYARAVGKEMGLSEPQLRDLHVAALLHDIGKLGIPDHILLKPGPLSPEEWEKMKTHPLTGAEMLSRMNFPKSVLLIVEAHHEKWDGTGYPRGLYEQQIPLGARILSAVDCLDALASERPYRHALPLEEAMTWVRAGKGASFDPKVIGVLEKRYVELERQAWAQSVRVPVSPPGSTTEDIGRLAANLLVELNSGSALEPIVSARRETRLLQRLSSELAHALQVKDIAAIVHQRLNSAIRFDTMALYVIRGHRMELVSALGEHGHLFSADPFPVTSGVSGVAAQRPMAILNGDPSLEPNFLNDSDVFYRLQAALAVPLSGRNGVIGTLTLYHSDRNAFSKDDLRLLEAASGHIGLAIEGAVIYSSVEEQAVTDHLTGIPNARSLAMHLRRELSRASRDGLTVGVLMCDLDGFKQINDQKGHLTGDEVLKQVAAGLRTSCRAADYFARMGGDEFVIIVPGLQRDSAPSYVERLRTVAVDAGWAVCGERCLSMSVGVAIYPEDGGDPEKLLGDADRRMYVAKQEEKAARALPAPSSAAAAGD